MRTRSLRTAVAVAVTAALVAVFAAPAAGAKKPSNTDGFDGKTITLGVITPLSGLVSVIGKPLTAGNQLWWDYYNAEKGGVGGKYKVELSQEDSAYQAPTAVQAYDKLKGDVVAFQQILGTQITKALLPKMQADKAVGAPATLDATWVHNPNLVPISAPYQIETINVLDYFVNNGGKGKKICALAQDDEYGQAGLDGLSAAKKALKLKTGPSPRFKTGEDLTAQIQQLADAKCEAVLLAATAADATAVATKSISLNFSPQYMALAPFWLPIFAKSANIADFFVEHLWVTAGQYVVWGDTSVPGMDKFLERQQKYAADQTPDPYFIFGYLQGEAMAQVLEQAVKNGDLSRDGLLKAVGQIKKLTFEGLDEIYTYGAVAKRNPPRATAVLKIDKAGVVGLAIQNPQTASATAKKYKIEG
jgi:ABC-type branched-subunit amino acid transport system substrate-binding protein